MEVSLTDRQDIAYNTCATEVLYGGAAGGGKSYFLRVSAIRWAMSVSGVQVYIFRRTYPDLVANHLRGPSSFNVLLSDALNAGRVKFNKDDMEYTFWNGSVIKLAHCQYDDDVVKYQGAEIHVLLIDELTHFTEYIYRFLRGRVRAIGLKLSNEEKLLLPRIEAGSNPGSVGHAWVKRSFVNATCDGKVISPMEVWRTPKSEGGMLRVYIPAKVSDNPYLLAEDPTYADRLEGLGNEALVRAMRDGDWDIVAGQAFEKLRKDRHGLEPFVIPDSWMRFRAMDWGSSHPFAIGWYAVSDGNPVFFDDRKTIHLPRGAIVKYREWYGWNGTPNEGARLEASEVARGIVRLSDGERYNYTVADPSMWKADGGESHAETFARNGVLMRRADNKRIPGYIRMRQMIAGTDGFPMFYIFNTCLHTWRTLPDLVMDRDNLEDVDTDQDDHIYDCDRYALMSRPHVEDKTVLKDTKWLNTATMDELFPLEDHEGQVWQRV